MDTEPQFEPSVKLASEMLGAKLKEKSALKKRHYKITDKVIEANRLRKHQWKKGQSGNPKGRPIKNLSLISLVKEQLEEHPEEAKTIALALIAMAKGKNLMAIQELFNRIDGKVAETHKIEGSLPITLQFVPACELLESKRQDVIDGEAVEVLEKGGEDAEGRSN